jgi:hypothetical protein
VTFGIGWQIDSSSNCTERHISWLELSEKLQQVRIVPPAFSRLPQLGFTHAQRLRLHLQIAFRIDVRGVDGDMTQPCSDRVDVDSCP